MDCPSCSEPMVVAKATDFGEEYHYCRKCKKELKELYKLEPPTMSISSVSPPLPPTRCGHIFSLTDKCLKCGMTGFDASLEELELMLSGGPR